MMGRSKIKVAKKEPLSDRDFNDLPEHEESTAEEIQNFAKEEIRMTE